MGWVEGHRSSVARAGMIVGTIMLAACGDTDEHAAVDLEETVDGAAPPTCVAPSEELTEVAIDALVELCEDDNRDARPRHELRELMSEASCVATTVCAWDYACIDGLVDARDSACLPPEPDANSPCDQPGHWRDPTTLECEDVRGQECVADDRCGLLDACIAGECQLRSRRVYPPSFVAEHLDVNTVSVTNEPIDDMTLYGGCVVDWDGDDESLELVVMQPLGGSYVVDADLSEVDHTIDALRDPTRDHRGCIAFQADDDEALEVAVYGIDTLTILDTVEGEVLFETELDGCAARAAVAADVDFDGRGELLLGCAFRNQPGRFEPPPPSDVADAVLRDIVVDVEDQTWSLAPWGDVTGSTLAFAVVRSDAGTSDVVSIHDTYGQCDVRSRLGGSRYTVTEPAGIVEQPLVGLEGESDSCGAFMGAAHIWIDDVPILHISNFGPRRSVRLDVEPRLDLRDELEDDAPFDLGLTLPSDASAFSWGINAFDFDRNGADDIYVVRGLAVRPYLDFSSSEQFDDEAMNASNSDQVLLQLEGSSEPFRVAELQRPSELSASVPGQFHGRGSLVADLEPNGEVEVVVYGADLQLERESIEYQPRLLRPMVDPANMPPVCSIIPRPWLIDTAGIGIELREAWGAHWKQPNIGGQMNIGTSPWLLSSHGAGDLRFPSGAVVSFDCEGTAGPVEVFEPPEWINVNRLPAGPVVCVDIMAWGTTPSGARALVDGTEYDLTPTSEGAGSCWAFEQPVDGDAAFQFDGRWVPYRWEL